MHPFFTDTRMRPYFSSCLSLSESGLEPSRFPPSRVARCPTTPRLVHPHPLRPTAGQCDPVHRLFDAISL